MLRDVIISFCEKILLCFIFVNSACFFMRRRWRVYVVEGEYVQNVWYIISAWAILLFVQQYRALLTASECGSDNGRFTLFMPLSCRNSSDQQKNNGDWLRQSLSAPCLLPVRAFAEFNQTRGYWPTYWLKPDCVQTEDLVSSLKLLSPGICIDGIAACCSSVF